MDVDYFYEKVKTFFHRENLLSRVELSRERSTRRIVIYVLPEHQQKSHHDHYSSHYGVPSSGEYSSSSSSSSRHHGGGAPNEKYFQCTECQFHCRGASDFANHLVVHSVEQRDQSKHLSGLAKTPFGDLPPMRSDHPDLRRGCPFHEGPCDNPAVCDFLAKERREQQEQALHGRDKHNGNGHRLTPLGLDDDDDDEDKVMASLDEDNEKEDKDWEPMQPMKGGYNTLDCNICGISFFHRKELKEHMLEHSGEKPFQCHLCGKSFSSSAAMNKHITNHSQNKPFKCTKCNRSFSAQQKLDKHLKLHEGNRTDCFMCTTCSVPFTRYSNLMRHCLAQNHPAPLVSRDKGKKEMGRSPGAAGGGANMNAGAGSMAVGVGEPQHQHQMQQLQQPQQHENRDGFLEKKRDCQKWTEMEDNWLVNGVREFGKGQWKQILEKYKGYFQYGRNRFTLRLRYAYLMKTGRIEMAPAIVSSSGDDEAVVQTNGADVANLPRGNPVAGVTGEIHEKLMAASN